MSRLASETTGRWNFSGLVTEFDDGWIIDDLDPFAAHVLNVFGANEFTAIKARVLWLTPTTTPT